MTERRYNVNECIAFNSKNENYVFSNMYPCDLAYDGKVFGGVDCLYFWLRSQLLGDEKLMNSIEKCKGINACFQAKKKFNEKYDEAGIDFKTDAQLMLQALTLKAEQCELFREKLLESGDTPLVEFAPWGDATWGTIKQGNEYVGVNATGRLMMKVRENLREKLN